MKLSPDAPELCNNLARLLATHPDVAVRNGARAVQLAEKPTNLPVIIRHFYWARSPPPTPKQAVFPGSRSHRPTSD